jgi:hypothetical protein
LRNVILMRSIAVRALRIKADKVRALVESILIIEDYSVLNYLLTQKCRAVFELDDIDRARQDLEQMAHASEQPISGKSFHSKIEV